MKYYAAYLKDWLVRYELAGPFDTAIDMETEIHKSGYRGLIMAFEYDPRTQAIHYYGMMLVSDQGVVVVAHFLFAHLEDH